MASAGCEPTAADGADDAAETVLIQMTAAEANPDQAQ